MQLQPQTGTSPVLNLISWAWVGTSSGAGRRETEVCNGRGGHFQFALSRAKSQRREIGSTSYRVSFMCEVLDSYLYLFIYFFFVTCPVGVRIMHGPSFRALENYETSDPWQNLQETAASVLRLLFYFITAKPQKHTELNGSPFLFSTSIHLHQELKSKTQQIIMFLLSSFCVLSIVELHIKDTEEA